MTDSHRTDISFITICYNGFKDTCELIESLQEKLHSVTYEIIVVDNASHEDEAAKISRLYPSVIAIRSEVNRGFSGGNNIGIRAARGKYLFFINNDTYIESDAISCLVERLESRPEIGGVSPKIRFAFPPQHIQFAGFTPLSRITLRNHMLGFGCPDDGKYDTPHPTPYLHGAAMMIKREVVEKAGMMPEIFFLYYEELDWSTSMTRVGYELWYEPRCTVFHKESQSTGQLSRLRTYYLTRNRLLPPQPEGSRTSGLRALSKHCRSLEERSALCFKRTLRSLPGRLQRRQFRTDPSVGHQRNKRTKKRIL